MLNKGLKAPMLNASPEIVWHVGQMQMQQRSQGNDQVSSRWLALTVSVHKHMCKAVQHA